MVGGIITFGVIILICVFCFMRGKSASPTISGNENQVKNIDTQDFSLFHYTDLSDKVESYNEIQENHNIAKYCMLAVIFGAIIFTVIYRCIKHKGKQRSRRRVVEAMEMTELHNDLLTRHGIVPRSYKKNEKKKEKRKRNAEIEEEEGSKEKKGRKKKENIEEEEDDWKQKPKSEEKAGEDEVTGDGAGDQKKKPQSKKRQWRWVDEDESE